MAEPASVPRITDDPADVVRRFTDAWDRPALDRFMAVLAEDVRLEEMPRVIGQDRTHMLLQVRSGTTVIKALAFGMASREHELRMSRPVDLVFTPRLSHWRGRTQVELILADFRCR